MTQSTRNQHYFAFVYPRILKTWSKVLFCSAWDDNKSWERHAKLKSWESDTFKLFYHQASVSRTNAPQTFHWITSRLRKQDSGFTRKRNKIRLLYSNHNRINSAFKMLNPIYHHPDWRTGLPLRNSITSSFTSPQLRCFHSDWQPCINSYFIQIKFVCTLTAILAESILKSERL